MSDNTPLILTALKNAVADRIRGNDKKTTREACKDIYNSLLDYDLHLLLQACVDAGFKAYFSAIIRSNIAAYLVTNSGVNLIDDGYPTPDELATDMITYQYVETPETSNSAQSVQAEISQQESKNEKKNKQRKKRAAEKEAKPEEPAKVAEKAAEKPEEPAKVAEKPEEPAKAAKPVKTRKQNKKTGSSGTTNTPKDNDNKESWFDLSEQEDSIRSQKKKELDAFKQSLTWAEKTKFSNVNDLEELKRLIQIEKENEAKRQKELLETQKREEEEKIAAEKAEQDRKEAEKKQQQKLKENRKAYISIPPNMRKAPASNGTKNTKNNDGFTVVTKKPTAKKTAVFNNSQNKLTTVNLKPENLKKVTSAGWFLLPKPILTEEQDWFLHGCDDNGNPIGWIDLGNNQWKINHNSQFIHTKHEDGTWTTQEIIPSYIDRQGRWIPERLMDVTVAYLGWVLTPPRLRTAEAPA
jgi:hypothetical protein